MTKTRKILGIVLVVMLLALAMSISAFAATTVTTEDELESAVANGGEVTLGADLSNVELTISQDTVLDLGGKTITDAYIIVKANVTIKNGFIKNATEPYLLKVTGSGVLTIEDVDIEYSSSDRVIWLDGSNSVLNFNSGSILATKGENNTKSKIYGIWVSTGATANINGGSITVDAGANATAVAIFGNYVNTVNITDGRISTSGKTYSYAIWTNGDVTVSGGEIITNEKQYGYSSGVTYGKNYAINTTGDVEISGGAITTNGPSGYLVNAGGSNQTVTISNVEFENVLSEADTTAGGHSEPNLIYGSSVTVEITGGEFIGVVETSVTNNIAEGATVTVNDTTYTKTEDGTLEEVVYAAKIGNKGYETFQAALDAVKDGETIVLVDDCDEVVTFTQTKDVSFVIDGNEKTFTGTINITARAGKDAPSTLVIKNINFKTDKTSHDFIKSVETNYYPNNITISNCSFEGTSDINTTGYAVVAVRLKSANNIKIENCSGTGLHSFLQNTAGWNLTVENVTITNSLSGLACGTVQGVTVKGCNFTTEGSGIRLDAQYNNNAVIENCTINAFIPVVVRKASVESNVTFNGTNTMTATNTDGLWMAIGTSEYQANGELPTAPTGDVKVALNDAGLDAKGVYGEYVEPPKGDVPNGYVGATTIWGETWSNAKESHVFKFYAADGTLMGTAELNPALYTFTGSQAPTWHINFNDLDGDDEWWIQEWVVTPSVDNFPTRVVLCVDGVDVNEGPIQFNGPDNINKIVALAEGYTGGLVAYTSLADAIGNFNGRKVNVVRDVTESIASMKGATLTTNVAGGVTVTNTYSGWVYANDLVIGKGVTVKTGSFFYDTDGVNEITGSLVVDGTFYHGYNATTVIKDGGNVIVNGTTILRYNNNADSGIYIYGDNDDATVEFDCDYYIGAYSGTFYAEDATIETGYFLLKNSYDNSNYANIDMTLDNSTLTVVGTTDTQDSFIIDDQASLTLVNGSAIADVRDFNILAGTNLTLTVDETSSLEATYVNIAEDVPFVAEKNEDGTIKLEKVVYVAQIGDVKYESLADALNAAVPGDTVTIFAGTYESGLSVTKDITVVGETDAEGNNLVTFNGQLSVTADGATVKNINVVASGSAGYIYANDVLIEGCNVTGGNGFRYCYTSGTVTFKDSTITGSTYGIHFDGNEGGEIVIDNCVITGWTSFAGSIKKVSMTDTKFEEGNYNYIRFYQDEIVLDGCTFNEKMGVDVATSAAGATVTVTDCTVENGTVEDLFEDSDIADCEITVDDVKLVRVAKIGDTYYETLQAAFAAANAGDTVVLLDNIAIDSEIITIADGKSVTFDMNGKKITVTDNKAANVCYELFYIYGELTVTGNGTIELTSTSNDTAWAKSSTIFHNRGGVLTIENGTFTHLGGTCMAYVVDNSGNYYGDATTNIIDGTLTSSYIAIRNRMEQNTHGASGKATLNVYGGTISGNDAKYAIWAQAASTSTVAPATGEINISGGTIGAIYTAYGAGAESMTTISGGTVSAVKCEVNELTVTGGNVGEVTILSTAGEEVEYAVTADGLYISAVAQIGDNKYATLQDAINAAVTGDTITLIDNIELDTSKLVTNSDGYSTIFNVAEKSIKIDLNGCNITVNAYASDLTEAKSKLLLAVFAVDVNGELTLTGDGKVEAIANDATVYSLAICYGEGGKLTFESGEYVLDKASSALVYSQTSQTVTVKGGNFHLGNVGTGANGSPWVFNVAGKNNGNIIVIGGTFNADVYNQYWVFEVQTPDNEYYACKNNGDGTWTVVPAVAYVTDSTTTSATYTSIVGYATLKDALAAVEEGEKVVLLASYEDWKMIQVTKTITLDLNGYEIYRTFGGVALDVADGTLTIVDSSEAKTGRISGSTTGITVAYDAALVLGEVTVEGRDGYGIDNDGIVTINGATITGTEYGIIHVKGELTLNSGSISGGSYGIVAYAGTVTINDGTVSGTSVGLSGEGGSHGTTYNINGGTVEGGSVGIYHPQNGTLNITDGTIKGSTGIAVKSGTINISGGTIIGNGEKADYGFVGGGFNSTGDALVIESCNYPGGVPVVSITGGTFTSANANAIASYTGNGVTEQVANFVSGGVFNTPVAKEYCIDGYISVDNGDGTYGVRVANYVVELNGVQYESLQAAIDAAVAGDTITFIGDINENVTINNNIILDGANFQYTGTITVNGNSLNVTIQKLNSVKGDISITGTNGTSTLTVKDCSFADGGYAITTNRIKTVNIENCTVTNQSLLYANKSTANINIKDVAISGGNYGVHWAYGTNATLENVTMIDMQYGIYTHNYGAKNITINNCTIEAARKPIYVRHRNETNVDTFNFEGVNNILALTDDTCASFVIIDKDAKVVTSEGLTVTTTVENSLVKYVDGAYVVVKAAAKVNDTCYETFAEALAALTDGATLTLLDNVTASEIITISNSVVFDGNYFTLTSTAARAINVSGADGVTIKNLTINCSGERAINVIQNATNVTIDNVTATAANYTVNVASSAANAVITINNSNLTGLCVVNVAGANAVVTINGGTINCVDENEVENYGALTIYPTCENAKITATGVTFVIGGDSKEASDTTVYGNITIDGVEYCGKKAAFIDYGNGNYYAFDTLADAIAKAKDGETVTLLRDIELSESIKVTGTVILDLNGKTITGTDNNVTGNFYLFNNVGDLTITGNGKITLTATTDRDWNASSVVIATNPGGKLTVENGTIEHLGGTDMAYALDNLTNGDGTYAETVVNDGTIKSTYRAIRQFLNGNNAQNILTINGGTIEGANKAIFFHGPTNKKPCSGTLTIGEGAVITGGVYLFVTEGSTEWPVEVSIATSALTNGASDVTSKNVPTGYEIVEENGTIGVEEKPEVPENVVWYDITLSLESDLKLNFYLLTSSLDLNGGYSYYARVIEHHDTGCSDHAKCEVRYIPISEWAIGDTYTRISIDGLAAKDMACQVEIQVFVGEMPEEGYSVDHDNSITSGATFEAPEGSSAVSLTGRYSILQYCKTMFGKTTEEAEAIKPLLADLLLYGKAAQEYFGHYVTAADGVTPVYVTSGIEDIVNSYATTPERDVTNKMKWHSGDQKYFWDFTLSLETTTYLNFYFKNLTEEGTGIEGFDINNVTAHVTFNHYDGKEHDVYYSVADETISIVGEGKVLVVVDDLAPADLFDLVHIELFYGEQTLAEFEGSADSYCAIVYANQDKIERGEEFAKVCDAIIALAEEAEEYFTKKGN